MASSDLHAAAPARARSLLLKHLPDTAQAGSCAGDENQRGAYRPPASFRFAGRLDGVAPWFS